ncbi:hypothetical protein CR513_03351, partial [Mucuna pruriens]
MEGPSIDWENLPLKSKFMISYIRELGEKLDKVGKGLDSVQKDTQSVNAKVEALSKGKVERAKIASMHESGGSYGGDNLSASSGERRRSSRSSMGKDVREIFFGYALVWWNQVLKEIKSDKKGPCEGWRDLKHLMKERFVPSSYIWDLHVKLQRLHQGSYSVEEYHTEMEMDLLRTQIKENEEVTIARFLHSLKREIQDVMELKHYKNLSELVHQDIKGKEREKDRTRREKSPKKRSEAFIGQKELTLIPTPMPPTTSSIKCFKCLEKGYIASQCPNRSVMIMKDVGEIESGSFMKEVSTSNESESLSDGSHYKGDLLMVRRLMNSHVREEAETQRENIFHSRCLILGNLCLMITNGGSCVSVASERLVNKLALPTIAHLRSYRLQWISEKGKFLVDR